MFKYNTLKEKLAWLAWKCLLICKPVYNGHIPAEGVARGGGEEILLLLSVIRGSESGGGGEGRNFDS